MEEMEATEVLIGVRENQMIINGIVYCDFCWCTRPDDRSLCPCLKDKVESCEDCANTKDPCAFCNPSHHANHKVAMAEMEKILASLEEQYPPCAACNDAGTFCETCDYIPLSSRYEENYHDDPDYNEHRFDY